MKQSAVCTEDDSRAPNLPREPAAWGFVPRVRLYVERLTVDRGDLLCPNLCDAEVPVLSVQFDYGGGAVFRACPPELSYSDEPSEDGFFVSMDGPRARAVSIARDLAGEARAAAVLESFGVVEIGR